VEFEAYEMPIFGLEVTYGPDLAPRGFTRLCQRDQQPGPFSRSSAEQQPSYLWFSCQGGEDVRPITNILVGPSSTEGQPGLVGWERLSRPLFSDTDAEVASSSPPLFLYVERAGGKMPVEILYIEMVFGANEDAGSDWPTAERILLSSTAKCSAYLCVERVPRGGVKNDDGTRVAADASRQSNDDKQHTEAWNLSVADLDSATDKFLNSLVADNQEVWETDSWPIKYIRRCMNSTFVEPKILPDMNKFLRLVLAKVCIEVSQSTGPRISGLLEVLASILSRPKEALLYRRYGIGNSAFDRFILPKDLSLEGFFVPAQRSLIQNIGDNLAMGLGFALPALGAAGRSLFSGGEGKFRPTSEVSTLLFTNLNHFGSCGGWDALVALLQRTDHARISLPQVNQCVSLFSQVTSMANQDFTLIYHTQVVRYFHQRLLALDHADYTYLTSNFGVINEGIRLLVAMVGKESGIEESIFREAREMFLLRFGKQLAFSQQPGLREKGIQILSELVVMCSNPVSVTADGLTGFTSTILPVESEIGGECISKWLTPKRMQNFLVSERIVVEILGGEDGQDTENPLNSIEATSKLRHELLRKSEGIIRFAAKQDMLTEHQLRVLWQAATVEPDSGIVFIESGVQKLAFNLLLQVVPHLSTGPLRIFCEQSKTYLLAATSMLQKDHVHLLHEIILRAMEKFSSAEDSACVFAPLDVLWVMCVNAKNRLVKENALRVLLEVFKADSSQPSKLMAPYLQRVVDMLDDASVFSLENKMATLRIVIAVVNELPSKITYSMNSMLLDSVIQSLPFDFVRGAAVGRQLDCLELRFKLFNSLAAASPKTQYQNFVWEKQEQQQQQQQKLNGRHSFLLAMSQINFIWNGVMEIGDSKLSDVLLLWLAECLPECKTGDGKGNNTERYSRHRLVDFETAAAILDTISASFDVVDGEKTIPSSWATVKVSSIAGVDLAYRIFVLINVANGHIASNPSGSGMMVKTSYLTKITLLVRLCRESSDEKVQQRCADSIAYVISRFDATLIDRRMAWLNFTQTLMQQVRQGNQVADNTPCRGLLILLASIFEAASAAPLTSLGQDVKEVTIFWRRNTLSSVTKTEKYLLSGSTSIGSLRTRIAVDQDALVPRIELRTSNQEILLLEGDHSIVGTCDWSVLEASVLDASPTVVPSTVYRAAAQIFEENSSPQMGPRVSLANDQQSMLVLERLLCGDNVGLSRCAWNLLAMLPLPSVITTQLQLHEETLTVQWAQLFGEGYSLRLLRPLSQLLVMHGTADQKWKESFAVKSGGVVYLTQVLQALPPVQLFASNDLNFMCISRLVRMLFRLTKGTPSFLTETLDEQAAGALARHLLGLVVTLSAFSSGCRDSSDEYDPAILNVNDPVGETLVDADMADCRVQVVKLFFRQLSILLGCWPNIAAGLFGGSDYAESIVFGLTKQPTKNILTLKTELALFCKSQTTLCDELLGVLLPSVGRSDLGDGTPDALFGLILFLLDQVPDIDRRTEMTAPATLTLIKLTQNSAGELHEESENSRLRAHMELLCGLLGRRSKDSPLPREFANHLFSSLMLPCHAFKSTRTREVAFELLSFLCAHGSQDSLDEILKILISQHGMTPRLGDPAISLTTTHKEMNRDSLHSRGILGIGGITNPGCVCYICSTLQVLYMMPAVRQAVFDIPPTHFVGNTTVSSQQDLEAVKQLQLLFVDLQESVRAAVNPRPFCSSFVDYDGRPTSLFEQQDASEFLFFFLQRLESVLIGSEQSALLQDALKGELSHNLFAEGGRMRSEGKEPFFLLSLEIHSADTLTQSLQQYVASEVVDFAWDVPSGDAPSDPVVKRTLQSSKSVRINKLPRHLLLHLKRFNLDKKTMQTYKIHKRFEFPMTLDMFPYTSQAAEERKKTKSGQLSTQCMFELTGVVIHSGQATGGHYYAYVREPGTNQWLEVNDGWVGPFKVESMDNEAFGGEDAPEPLVATQQSPVKAEKPPMSIFGSFVQLLGMDAGTDVADITRRPYEKHRSAFLLVYSRVEAVPSTSLPASVLRVRLPKHLSDKVSKDSLGFFRSKLVYSVPYLTFASQAFFKTLKDRGCEAPVLQSCLGFFFGTLLRARLFGRTHIGEAVKPLVLQFSNELTRFLRSDVTSSQWLLTTLTSSQEPENDVLQMVLFGFENAKESKLIMLIVDAALECLLALDDDSAAAPWDSIRQFIATVYSAKRLDDAQSKIWQCSNYFWLPMETLSRKVSLVRAQEIRSAFVEKMLLYFSAKDSLLDLALTATDGGEASRAQAHLKRLVQALSNLVSAGEYCPQDSELVLFEMGLFTSRLAKLIVDDKAKPLVHKLLHFANFEKREASLRSIEAVVRLLSQSQKNRNPKSSLCKPAMRCIMLLIAIDDSLQQVRIDASLSQITSFLKTSQHHNTNETQLCLEMLLRLAKSSIPARLWIFEHARDLEWIKQWLTRLGAGKVDPSSHTYGHSTLSQFTLLLHGKAMNASYDSDDDEAKLVGSRIKVRFGEGNWYTGRVTKIEKHVTTVHYDDGEVLEHDLSTKAWYLIE